jgi:hypothetical protein
MVKKSSIFWDITLYILLKLSDVLEQNVASIFRVEEWAKKESSAYHQLSAGSLLDLFFDDDGGREMILTGVLSPLSVLSPQHQPSDDVCALFLRLYKQYTCFLAVFYIYII